MVVAGSVLFSTCFQYDIEEAPIEQCFCIPCFHKTRKENEKTYHARKDELQLRVPFK
jgi:hypothetical protein